MSYLNDPNTHRMATRCCCCGRKLLDAKSVEIGIGPTCRNKFGYTTDITDDQRETVNKLIHDAGVQCEIMANKELGDVARYSAAGLLLDVADRIEGLGLSRVASKVRERFTGISLDAVKDTPVYEWDYRNRREVETDRTHTAIVLRAPYSADFNHLRKNLRLRGRPVKTNDGFHWEFSNNDKRLVDEVVRKAFAGMLAIGPKGIFVIKPWDADKEALHDL